MIDAASYGRALFQLAEEDGCGDGVLEELQLVRRALRENPGYVTLMDTPAVAGPENTPCCCRPFPARRRSCAISCACCATGARSGSCPPA